MTISRKSRTIGAIIGFAKGAEVPDSFFEPLSEEDLQAWGL